MPPPAYSADDLRYAAERIARDLGVPFERVVEFTAGLGGIEQFVEPESIGGFMSFQEKVLSFCRRYLLDHLPPGQRDAVGLMAQRRNTFTRSEFVDAATPIMRRFGVQLSDWDSVIQGALHVPGLQHLRHYHGPLSQAIQDLTVHLEERTLTVADTQLKTRSEKITETFNGWFAELGITDKAQQGTHKKNALKATQPAIVASGAKIEDVVAQINAYFEKIKASKDDLAAHGLGGNGRPPVGTSEQSGLFDAGLAKSAEDLKKLLDKPKLDFKGDPIKTPAATVAAESSVKVDDAKEAPAAPPVGDTASAGAAIPDITATSASAPADAKAAVAIEPTPQVLTGSFSQTAPDGFAYSCVLDEIDAGKSYAADIAVDDLVAIGEAGKTVIEGHIRSARNLPADAAIVFTWSETNPSVERIQALRERCAELAKKTYPTLSASEQAEKIKTAWNGATAKDALCLYGDQGAYDKVHELFAKLEIEPQPESALTTTTPKTEIDLPPQPGNVIQFPSMADLGPFVPTPARLSYMKEFAGWTARSGMYAVKTFEQAMMICWRSDELHVPWGTGLRGIHLINGKPWEGAEVLKAVVDNSNLAERFDIVPHKDKAVAYIKRKGKAEVVVEYTLEEAKTAGLLAKPGSNWMRNPGMMLIWRVTRRACILHFADLCAGLGIPLIDQDPYQDEEDVAA